MDSLSKQELISTITKQADQIKRYEARLRGKFYLFSIKQQNIRIIFNFL